MPCGSRRTASSSSSRTASNCRSRSSTTRVSAGEHPLPARACRLLVVAWHADARCGPTSRFAFPQTARPVSCGSSNGTPSSASRPRARPNRWSALCAKSCSTPCDRTVSSQITRASASRRRESASACRMPPFGTCATSRACCAARPAHLRAVRLNSFDAVCSVIGRYQRHRHSMIGH